MFKNIINYLRPKVRVVKEIYIPEHRPNPQYIRIECVKYFDKKDGSVHVRWTVGHNYY